MIGESGLAGINRRLELRNASLLLGVYVVAGLLAAAAVAALSVSYARNRDFLEQVGAAIGVFEQTAQVEPKSPLNAIVARLDAIRGVVDLADRYRETTSMPMRWGLYRGAIDQQLGARCVRARARQHPAPACSRCSFRPG